MLRAVWRRIWRYKFVIFSILFFCLTIHYGAEYCSQKKEAATYKAKYEAVFALFKSLACSPCPAKLNERSGACPRIEAPKCPPQVQPVPPETSQSAPISRRKSAPRQAEPVPVLSPSATGKNSERDRLLDLAEKALNEDSVSDSNQVSPAINRRDGNGRLKPPQSNVRVIRIPKWLDK